MKNIPLPRLFQTKVVACAGLVVLADVLLFGGQPWGASLAVFSAALLAAVVWLNGVHLKPFYMKAILALTAGLVFSFLLSPNLLAGGLFVAGLASLALLSRQAGVQSWQWVKDMLNVPALLVAQYYLDNAKLKKLQAKNKTKKAYSSLIGYVLFPAVFGIAFVYLFAKVNPAWQDVLDAIDIVALLSVRRWLFWVVAALIIWAFLRMRLPRGRMALSTVPVNLDFWISKNSVIISLVIFNILFAVQNGMDVAGFAGMADVAPTLAKQAQNAAYPLIFTVMLAALYVLLVFDDRQQKYHSRAAKILTAIWVVQNIVLTFSAVYRNMLYIDQFSLTLLRLSAMIWMGLIVLGLVFILLRFLFGKSNAWLVGANLVSLLSVLYVCCFVNFDRVIVNYNYARAMKEHRIERFDVHYAGALGPQSLPVLWTIYNDEDAGEKIIRKNYMHRIGYAEIELDERAAAGWRAWTLRDHWLRQEVAVIKAAAQPPVAEDEN